MIKEDIDDLKNEVKAYAELRAQLMRVQVVEVGSKQLSKAIAFFVFALLALMVLVISTLAAGYYLNALWNSRYAGFLIIAAGYLLVMVMLYAFRKNIFYGWVRNQMIDMLDESLTENLEE